MADRRSTQDDLEADGIPGHEDSVPNEDPEISHDEGLIPPGDHWHGAEHFGTTANEQRAGETVRERAAQEEPDPVARELDRAADDRFHRPPPARSDADRDAEAGELTSVDDVFDTPEWDGEEVARQPGGTAYSAEEAAMHVEPE